MGHGGGRDRRHVRQGFGAAVDAKSFERAFAANLREGLAAGGATAIESYVSRPKRDRAIRRWGARVRTLGRALCARRGLASPRRRTVRWRRAHGVAATAA